MRYCEIGAGAGAVEHEVKGKSKLWSRGALGAFSRMLACRESERARERERGNQGWRMVCPQRKPGGCLPYVSMRFLRS